MDDNEYFPLGHLGSAEVGVRPTLDGQYIWIEHSNIGQRLACLLATYRLMLCRAVRALAGPV